MNLGKYPEINRDHKEAIWMRLMNIYLRNSQILNEWFILEYILDFKPYR